MLKHAYEHAAHMSNIYITHICGCRHSIIVYSLIHNMQKMGEKIKCETTDGDGGWFSCKLIKGWTFVEAFHKSS